MKVFLRGSGKKVSLLDKDFKAQGGEGRIYEKNGVIYKVYLDKSRMIPLGKIKELQLLKM